MITTNRCSTGKVIYSTQALANRAIAVQPDKQGLSTYLCDSCTKYHLTRVPFWLKVEEEQDRVATRAAQEEE